MATIIDLSPFQWPGQKKVRRTCWCVGCGRPRGFFLPSVGGARASFVNDALTNELTCSSCSLLVARCSSVVGRRSIFGRPSLPPPHLRGQLPPPAFFAGLECVTHGLPTTCNFHDGDGDDGDGLIFRRTRRARTPADGASECCCEMPLSCTVSRAKLCQHRCLLPLSSSLHSTTSQQRLSIRGMVVIYLTVCAYEALLPASVDCCLPGPARFILKSHVVPRPRPAQQTCASHDEAGLATCVRFTDRRPTLLGLRGA